MIKTTVLFLIFLLESQKMQKSTFQAHDNKKAADVMVRLTEAAGEVFAEHGFDKATIREICKRASTNVAAINYYFGDKKNLYHHVIKELITRAVEKYPLTPAMDTTLPAPRRLQIFIELLLWRFLDKGRPAWAGKIITREMEDPTDAIEYVFEMAIKPTFNLLISIVRDICGKDATDEKVKLSAAGIIAQCNFYFHSRGLVSRMTDEGLFPQCDIKELAEHITAFSLGGLQNKSLPTAKS